ncbi:serine/threonine protein kinase, partial [bacterium AH-315-E10]|nr:serine/threonine protein kinase [bacterium AH-315-E10]
MLTFKCHSCNTTLEVDDDLAGKRVACAQCETVLQVPELTPALVQSASISTSDLSAPTIIDFIADRDMSVIELDDDKNNTPLTSHQLNLERGKKYDITKLIGRGGMGLVLDAKDLNIRRHVAMKIITKSDADSNNIKRFVEEAQISAQLEHPNIIPVHELGVDENGDAFYTMKYIHGSTLDEILTHIAGGKFKVIKKYPLSRLLAIFIKVCDAIAYAHSKGVIHRDLKPENIMVGNYAEVLVLDWGISKVLDDNRVDASSTEATIPTWSTEDIKSFNLDSGTLMTLDGMVVGTPGFMAPEQCMGLTNEIDQLTDIYQLGAVLYNLVSLNNPVSGKDVTEVMQKTVNGEVEDPSVYNLKGELPGVSIRKRSKLTYLEHCPDYKVPPAIASVIMKAMARERTERYQSVLELQRDIESYLSGFATGAE